MNTPQTSDLVENLRGNVENSNTLSAPSEEIRKRSMGLLSMCALLRSREL
jgi:hypothetical protein